MKPFSSPCSETKRGVDVLNPPGLTGLEPAASALTGRCSDRLNYNPSFKIILLVNLLLIRNFKRKK